MADRAVKLRITGRVQGVGFRAWTADRAAALGLNGFVRNRRDGAVEALLSGPAEAVERLIVECRQGPSLARVERVDVEPAQGITPAGFRQLPTV